MKSLITTTSTSVQLVLSLVLALMVGVLHGAEPVALTPVNVNAVHNDHSNAQSEVIPAGFALHLNNVDGIPLAREDVVLPQMAVSGSSGTSPADETQLKISSRATSSSMQSFLARTSLQQLQTVYREASQMIDVRHVNPPSYEVRTQGAVSDIISALNNTEFLRVNGASQNYQSVQSVQAQLQQMIQTQPARDVNQALALMQTTAELVNRATGIRREAVALEFLNGTMDTLDKYSAFMPEAGNGRPGAMLDTVMTAGLEENIVGVGVELKGHAQGVEIVGVVENSPASELGLQEGDVIIAINQQSMSGRTLNDVADRLAGTAGSSVNVEILRGNQKFRGTMVRRKVYVSSVTGTKIIDTQNATGYIRLKQFSDSSATDLEKALWTLHNQGMKNLVLDLRGNPGGLLDVCVTISDMFLTKGTIVSTRGRNASDNTTESATFPKTWAVPLVVLVDENSASASEIFAAAMQENQRGIIVGRTSYGKGTVQTHFPMNSVPAILKLTTAKFYSPNGREMANVGVTPDVPVATTTTGYRGTNNDSDVQTANMLISRGAPSQLLAGNLNPSQLNVAPVNKFPSYNNTPNYNANPNLTPNWNNAPNYNTQPTYTPNYPTYNNGNFGNGGFTPDYNLTNNWNTNPSFNNGSVTNGNYPSYNNPTHNNINGSRPSRRPGNFPGNGPNYNSAPNWNAAPGEFLPGMTLPNLFAPQANQVPAGMKDL